MSELQFFMKEISNLSSLFEKSISILSNDHSNMSESQFKILEQSKDIYDEIEKINIDIICINLLNLSVNINIFNPLIYNINNFDNLVFRKKVITRDKYLNQYFNNLKQIKDIDLKIKINEKDIHDVITHNSGMPGWEKDKYLSEFKKNIDHLNSEKKLIENNYLWIKTNYYWKTISKGWLIVEKIDQYFKASVLNDRNEIIPLDIVEKLYEQMKKDKIFKTDKSIDSQNFYAILNLKNPTNDCSTTIKVTKFGHIFYLLLEHVKKMGLNEKEWSQFIIEKFNFRKNTLKSRNHADKNENKEESENFKLYKNIILG